ncbi:alpha/beta hydrolase [Acinetobacter sp. ANC 5383]
MTKKIILVHGAWQGSWVWQPILQKLYDAGCEVKAIDLPGHGKDNTPHDSVTLESYTNKIIKESHELSQNGDIILVGHSMGGAAITQAAAIAPHYFAKLIYVCAFLPQTGESVASLAEQSHNLGTLGPITQIYPELGSIKLVPNSISNGFFNNYNNNDLEQIISLFQPQPINPIITPILQTDKFKSIDKIYIKCTNDAILSPLLQQKMADLANISNLQILKTGHEPFFTEPDALAKIILKSL